MELREARRKYIELMALAKKRNMPYKPYSGLAHHHILPKKLFPLWKKRASNIVVLTEEEHHQAHMHLAEIYPNCKGLRSVLPMIEPGHGQKSQDLWNDSEYRSKVTESNKKTWSTDERRRQHSELLKEISKNPEVIQHRLDAAKRTTCQRVRCIETGDEFPSMKEAAAWAGLSSSCSPKIGECCRNERRCAGRTPNGERATWEYVGFSKRTALHPVTILDEVPIFQGTKDKRTDFCFWTDGVHSVRAKAAPGPEWRRGMTKR